MRKILLAFLILFLTNSYTFAVDNKIDTIEQDCINKAFSTQNISACTIQAQNAWQNEIEKYYNLLFNILPKDKKHLLKKSQKDWKKYKKSQFDLLDNTIFISGTMYSNVIQGYKRDIYKYRAIELEELYFILLGCTQPSN